ncbi:MAG: glycerol-3-phosphate acyltransferase [Clostridia bacterium]|nr:glycerol-3-phosphate acyltransferase [Clostridia bacterium]
MYWWLFLLCPLAYLVGGFNVAKTVTKIRNVDLSKIGSGNAGATNVGRAMGFKWFLLVTILEGIKCASIATIGYLFVSFYTGTFTLYQESHYIVILAMGVSAIFGAIFPVWYRFKGGKGLATWIGLGFVLNPLVMLVVAAIYIPLLAITHIMSLSTVLGVITWTILSLCVEAPLTAPVIVLYCACVALILYSHRKNIVRLFTGKENKFILKKSAPKDTSTNDMVQSSAE